MTIDLLWFIQTLQWNTQSQTRGLNRPRLNRPRLVGWMDGRKIVTFYPWFRTMTKTIFDSKKIYALKAVIFLQSLKHFLFGQKNVAISRNWGVIFIIFGGRRRLRAKKCKNLVSRRLNKQLMTINLSHFFCLRWDSRPNACLRIEFFGPCSSHRILIMWA